MSDEVDRVGTCPICQTLLVEMGSLVVCPGGDYKASFDDWDRIWFTFDADTDLSSILLINLQNLNLIEVKK